MTICQRTGCERPHCMTEPDGELVCFEHGHLMIKGETRAERVERLRVDWEHCVTAAILETAAEGAKK